MSMSLIAGPTKPLNKRAAKVLESLRTNQWLRRDHTLDTTYLEFALNSVFGEELQQILEVVAEQPSTPPVPEPKYAFVNGLADQAVATRKAKGFGTPTGITGGNGELTLAKLMLVASEASEYVEEVSTTAGHSDAAEEELADVVIRIMDILRTQGADLSKELEFRRRLAGKGSPDQSYERDALFWTSTAAEYVRDGDAVAFHRCLYCLLERTERQANDLWGAVQKKLEKNKNRPPLHGRQLAV